jgi:hypothetical protein
VLLLLLLLLLLLYCCCYIAAEYGTKPWVNPVLSKALEIRASSPASRYTDPKVWCCQGILLYAAC